MFGYGPAQAARRTHGLCLMGIDPPTTADLLDAQPALYARWDPRYAANAFADSAGTVPVGAPGDAVRRLADVGPHGSLPLSNATTARAPLWREGAVQFDGVDDRLAGTFAAPKPALADIAMLFRSTDNDGVLLADSLAFKLVGIFTQNSGSASAGLSAGSPQIVIDSVPFAGTRGQLFSAVADGVAHRIELRQIDVQSWAGIAFGLTPFNDTLQVAGRIVPLAMLDAGHAQIAAARDAARAYAQEVLDDIFG